MCCVSKLETVVYTQTEYLIGAAVDIFTGKIETVVVCHLFSVVLIISPHVAHIQIGTLGELHL